MKELVSLTLGMYYILQAVFGRLDNSDSGITFLKTIYTSAIA